MSPVVFMADILSRIHYQYFFYRKSSHNLQMLSHAISKIRSQYIKIKSNGVTIYQNQITICQKISQMTKSKKKNSFTLYTAYSYTTFNITKHLISKKLQLIGRNQSSLPLNQSLQTF